MANGVSEELIYRIRVDMEKAIADFKKVKKALEEATGKSATASKVGAAELSIVKKNLADRLKVTKDFNKQMAADTQKRAQQETAALVATFKQQEAAIKRQNDAQRQYARDEQKRVQEQARQIQENKKAIIAGNKSAEASGISQIATWAKVGASIYAAYQASKMFFDSIAKGVQFNAMLESSNMAFGVMLKSMDKGAKLMGELRDLSMTTPIGLQEAAKSAKQLIAYGFGATTLVQNMKMLGTVTAATGGNIDDLAYVYGTLRTQGRAYTRDLMQFAMRGIPIYENLAAVMGVQANEVKKMTEEGKVGFAEVEKAFIRMTSEGGVYFGMLEASMQTLDGKMKIFGRTVEMALGQATQGISGPLKELLDNFTISMRNMEPSLLKFGESLGQIVQAIGPLAIALSETLVSALGLVGDILAKALTVLSPILTVILNLIKAVLDMAKAVGVLGVALGAFIASVLVRWPIAMIGAANGTVAFTGALGGLKFALASFIATPAGAILLALAGIAAIGGVITVVTATQKEYKDKITSGLKSNNPKDKQWAINESRYNNNGSQTVSMAAMRALDFFVTKVGNFFGKEGNVTFYQDVQKAAYRATGQAQSFGSANDVAVFAKKLGQPLMDTASALYKQGVLTEKVWQSVGSYAQKAATRAGMGMFGQPVGSPQDVGPTTIQMNSEFIKAITDLGIVFDKYKKAAGANPTQTVALGTTASASAFRAEPGAAAFIDALTPQYEALSGLAKKLGNKDLANSAAEAWNSAIMDSLQAVAEIIQKTTDEATKKEYEAYAKQLQLKLKPTNKGANLPEIKTTDLYQELLASATMTQLDNNALELSRAMANAKDTYTEVIKVYEARGMLTEAQQAESDMLAAQKLLTEKYGKLADIYSAREPYDITAVEKDRIQATLELNSQDMYEAKARAEIAQQEINLRKANINALGEALATKTDNLRNKWSAGEISTATFDMAIEIVKQKYEDAAAVEQQVINARQAVVDASLAQVEILNTSNTAIKKELNKIGTASPIMIATLNAASTSNTALSNPTTVTQLANINAQFELQKLLDQEEYNTKMAAYTSAANEREKALRLYDLQLFDYKRNNAEIEHQLALDNIRREAMLSGDSNYMKNLQNAGLDNINWAFTPGGMPGIGGMVNNAMAAGQGAGQVAAASALSGTQLGATVAGANPLAQIAVAFGDALKNVESFGKLLNWAGTIVDSVFKILGPILQAVFLPFANILEFFGEVLGAIAAPANALLSAFTSFAYILNMIVSGPIQVLANALLWVAKAIADYLVNPIIRFANALADVMNRLFGWMGIHIKKLSELEILTAEEQAAKTTKEKQVADALDKFKAQLNDSISYLKNKLQEQASKAVKAAQDLYEVGAISATQYEQDVTKANQYLKALEESNVLNSVKGFSDPKEIYAAILGLQATQQAIEDEKLKTAKEANTYLANILAAITKGTSPYLPTFASGAGTISRDMVAGIHKGEMIVPADFASSIRSGEVTLGGNNSNNGGETIYVTVHVAGTVKSENDLIDAIAKGIYRKRRTGALTI